MVSVSYNTVMIRRYARPILAFAVLAMTIIGSIYFLLHHPAVGHKLIATNKLILLQLLLLYFLFMGSLWLVFRSSLVICNIRLPKRETMLVTAYSSIINFFGPLQSGPAFRMLYLKKRHSVSLKQYGSASLLYYFFYALYSGFFLISGLLKWWTIPLLALANVILYILILRYGAKLKLLSFTKIKGIALTALSSFLQVSVFAVIFYVELHSVDASVTMSQALVYTGAANFALFVSITPAAIGFRESFVLLTQQLHHISSTTIVAASLLDRGVYVSMLILMGILIFGSHAKQTITNIRS